MAPGSGVQDSGSSVQDPASWIADPEIELDSKLLIFTFKLAARSGRSETIPPYGLAQAVAGGTLFGVEAFISQVVTSHQGQIINYPSLAPFANLFASRVKQFNCVAHNIQPIYDEMVRGILDRAR